MKTTLLSSLILGFAITSFGQSSSIVASFDTYVDIWGDGQTRRDGEAVMAARNSTTSSNVQIGFQELSGVPLAAFDVSSLSSADLVGKQVFFQVALAGFNIDPGSDGVTIGAYRVLDDFDASAVLFGPKIDFVNFTVGVDWDGDDYLAGATFPGTPMSRADIELLGTVDLTTAFLADAGVWNNYSETLSFDVTDLVNAWVDGSITNTGIALWIDPDLPLNQIQEQVNFTTLENTNATGIAGESSPARLLITVPEPSTYALIFGAFVMACILFQRSRRK